MSLEDDLDKINEVYAEMELETVVHSYGKSAAYNTGRDEWLCRQELLSLLLEAYAQATKVGWDTKVLDAISKTIREPKRIS